MSRKLLRNRLENLFEEIQPEEAGEARLPEVQGWTWECDASGAYSACSPEIQTLLGYRPDELLGAPLASFALAAESAEAVQAVLTQRNEQTSHDLQVQFQKRNGDLVAARVHILPRGGAQPEGGLRGFVQIVPRSSESPTQPVADAPERPRRRPEEITRPIKEKSRPARQAPSNGQPRPARKASSRPAAQPAVAVQPPSPQSGATEIFTRSTPQIEANTARLVAPLHVQNQQIGALELIDEDPNRYWSSDEQALVEQVLDQLTLALENAQLFQETRENARRNQELYLASQKLAAARDLQGVLTALLESIPAPTINQALLWEIRREDEVSETGEVELIAAWHQHTGATLPPLGMTMRLSDFPVPDLTSLVEPVWSSDVQSHRDLPEAVRAIYRQYSAHAFILLPLWLAGRQIGLLSLTGDQPYQFEEQDIQPYRSLSSQLAVVIDNRNLFEQTRQALDETERLYNLSARLNEAVSIEDILHVVCLPASDGQHPFAATLWQFENDEAGQPQWTAFTNAWVAPNYRLVTPFQTRVFMPDFPGSAVLLANPDSPLLFADVRQKGMDRGVRELLQINHADAAAFLPLILSGRWLGMVVILWGESTRFTERDFQRFRSLAAQAAVSINNRLLFEQSERRAQQLEWLSLIKDSLSKAIDEEGILSALSLIVEHHTPPNGIELQYLVLDDNGQPVRLDTVSTWEDGLVLSGTTWQERPQDLQLYTHLGWLQGSGDQPHFISDTRQAAGLPEELVQQAALDGFGALAVLPLYSANRWHGLVRFTWSSAYQASSDEVFYFQEVLEPVAAAVASRRSYLAEQQARRESERQRLQLETAARISRSASGILEPNELMQQTVELVRIRFELYYVGLFLVDQNGEWTGVPGKWAVLRAGTGEAGQQMLLNQHRLEIGSASMIGQCVASGKPQLWQGQAGEFKRFANPLLPNTLSEMALPLISRGAVIGAMTFQSERAGDFSEVDIEILHTMADQVANAIQNAYLFDQSQTALSETDLLYRASADINTAGDYDAILGVLENYTVLGAGAINLSINYFDRPWIGEDTPDWVETLARHTLLPEQALSPRYPLAAFPSAQQVLRPDTPTYVEDIANDPLIDENSRAFYHKRFGAASTIFIPLVVGGRWIGFINAMYGEITHFPSAQVRRLLALANQAAVAVQNLQSVEVTRQQAAEATLLFQTSQRLVQAQNEIEIYRTALEACRQIGEMDAVYLMRYREIAGDSYLEQVVHDTPAGVMAASDGTLFPRQLYPFSELVSRGETVISPALENDPRFVASERGLLAEFGIFSMAAIPVRLRGQVIAILVASYRQAHIYQPTEVRFLETVAVQLGISLDNHRLLQETQRRARQLQTAAEVSRAANSLLDIDNLLQQVVNLVQSSFELYYVALFLVDRDGQWTGEAGKWAVLRAGTGVAGLQMRAQGHKLAVDEHSMIGACVFSGKARVSLDVAHEPGRFQNPLLPKTRSEMALPLVALGDVIGAMSIQSESEAAFTQDDIATLQTMADQVAIAIQNARLFGQTQQALSESDTLYQANAALSAAQTYQDVLEVLRKFTPIGSLAANISIGLFDQPWVSESMPEWYEPVARWSRDPNYQPESGRYPMEAWSTARLLMQPDAPTVITDMLNDPRLDQTARQVYGEVFKAQGLMFLPLNVAGLWIGHLICIHQEPLTISDVELRRLNTMTSQAAVVLQNIRNRELDRQRAVQLEKLSVLQAALSQAGNEKEILISLAGASQPGHLPTHIKLFYLLLDEARNPEAAQLVASWQNGAPQEVLFDNRYNLTELPASEAWLNLNDDPLLVSQIAADDRLTPATKQACALAGDQALAVLPLRSGGYWQGLVTYTWDQPHVFTTDEKFLLDQVLGTAAEVLARRRAYIAQRQARTESERRAQEMALLFEVSQSLANAPLVPEEIARIVTERFGRIFEASECNLALLEGADYEQTLCMVGAHPPHAHAPGEHGVELIRLMDVPLFATVLSALQPRLVQAQPGASPADEQAYLRRHQLNSLLLLPLASKGQAIGLIQLMQHDPHRQFNSNQLNLAMTLANAAAATLENARLYEEQRQTAERLQEVDTLKTQFLANMSHELRTPLNSIIGFSRVILKGIDGPVTPLQEQDLNAIYNSGQHLLALITNILDLSKIEAGKMELAMEEVNLIDIINSVMSTAVGLTKEKPIELKKDLQPDLPMITGDRTRLRQVLLNLISNAAKFTEQGVIKVSAQTRKNAFGRDEVLVSVSDTGAGISLKDQEKLFKPFSQVDASPTRKTGGTGLGLSISRRLIEMHGGTIGVKSDEDQGSTFYFTLPLPQPAEDDGLSGEIPDNSRLILAIDDNRQVIQLYERYLSMLDFHVIPVTDPAEALAAARRYRPFAITLDVMMPVRDGWHVLEELKNDPETSEIPVIICSILQEEEKGFSLGAADYLVKPILEEDLVQAVHRLDGGQETHSVLAVDDDADTLRLVRKVLEASGKYQVTLAQTGAEALLALRAQRPDIVILDLYLPDLNGFNLLETLRADPALRDLPVVILTGGSLDDEQRLQLAAFAQAMLQKGLFREEDLLKTLQKALQRFSSSRQISPQA